MRLIPGGRLRKATLLLAALAVAAASSPSTAGAAQPQSGAWAPTGSLIASRNYFTATLLKSGKVLVVGGLEVDAQQKPKARSASAELYDPATGKWATTGALAIARSGHSATLLENGKVLVVGGAQGDPNQPNPRLASAELYDPATGKWANTGALTTARSSHTATLLETGKVLVTGGLRGEEMGQDKASLLAEAEIYDPATGKWSSTSPLPSARSGHTATLLDSGRVLVVGGSQDLRTSGELYASAAVYDPATGKWTTASGSGGRRSGHTATLLKSGKVLVVGGLTNAGIGPNAIADLAGRTAAAELYDPTVDTWAVTGALPFAPEAQLFLPRVEHATVLNSGKALFVGISASEAARRVSVQLYDASAGTWAPVEISAVNLAGSAPNVTLLKNGKVLVVPVVGGGEVAYVYTPPGLGRGGAPWLWAGAALAAILVLALLLMLVVRRRGSRRGARRPAPAGGGFAS